MHLDRSLIAPGTLCALFLLLQADHAAAQEKQPAANATPAPAQASTPSEAQDGAVAQAHSQKHDAEHGSYGSDSVVTGGVTPPGVDATSVREAPEPVTQAEQGQPPVDPSQAPATQQDVQFVQEDLTGVRTDLENFKFQWQRERDLHTATTTRFLVINGVVQTRFGWQDEPVNSATVFNRKTSFDVPTALLSFNGTLYRDYEEGKNLTYSIRYGVSQQQAGNNSFLNLLDAQITYNFLSTINPEDARLTVTAGQQLLPFGLEVPATEELKPVIRNAQFTLPGGFNLNRREVGVIFRGDAFPVVDYGYNYRAPILQYAFGAVNGSGPNQLDDNNFKDLVGRLAFTVPSGFNSWLRQITVGATGYYGKQNLSVTAADGTKPLLKQKGDKYRYGVDVYYNHWPFGLTYEYIRARDEVAAGATVAAATVSARDADSHTATAFLSFGEQFVAGFRNQGRFDDWWPKTYQPFLRYDRLDVNKDKKADSIDIYTAGFNLFFAETTKAQFNYNLRNARSVSDHFSHEVLAQAQFGF